MSITKQTIKKAGIIGLLTSSTLILGSVQAAEKPASASDIARVAATVVNFLTDAMYPDSSKLAQTEKSIFNKEAELSTTKNPIKAGEKKSNSNLLVSSLSSLPGAIRNTPVITKNGLVAPGTDLGSASYYSKTQMQSFLCGNGVPEKACFYNPTVKNPLIKTLIGDPSASAHGGLTTSDTVLSNKKQEAGEDFNLNPGARNTNEDSSEATAFLNYNSVLNNTQPENLLAAKYYGLYLTGAYDINLANTNYKNRQFLNQATLQGLSLLRNNSKFQKYVLATRKIAATNSTLMSNILYLAGQEVVNTPKPQEGQEGQDTTHQTMSQSQLDHMIGNRRLDDGGKWVDKVNTESPTQLLREQTLMMAEALHQRETNHELMKRMLATLTIVAAEGKAAYAPDLKLVKKSGRS